LLSWTAEVPALSPPDAHPELTLLLACVCGVFNIVPAGEQPVDPEMEDRVDGVE